MFLNFPASGTLYVHPSKVGSVLAAVVVGMEELVGLEVVSWGFVVVERGLVALWVPVGHIVTVLTFVVVVVVVTVLMTVVVERL